ncbi:MAG: HupE/UreJ family protein, partial [Cytophagaceae bacterium]|nr:HupE/UreJ family protein [Gemmatimonadaceae bacterium]
MVSELTTYLRLGLTHIADLQGYDHIAFIVALTAGFQLADWRRLLWLVTAFTVGHSLTLLLATLDVVRVPSSVVEPLIAATILVAGVRGITTQWRRTSTDHADRSLEAPWVMAAGFGLIHGLGFSGFLRSLLGSEDSLAIPLLGFNLGLEVGQLAIVASVLALGWVCTRSGLPRRWWALGLSALA